MAHLFHALIQFPLFPIFLLVHFPFPLNGQYINTQPQSGQTNTGTVIQPSNAGYVPVQQTTITGQPQIPTAYGTCPVNFVQDGQCKQLGFCWNPTQDCLNGACCKSTSSSTPGGVGQCPYNYAYSGACTLNIACGIGEQCVQGACCRQQNTNTNPYYPPTTNTNPYYPPNTNPTNTNPYYPSNTNPYANIPPTYTYPSNQQPGQTPTYQNPYVQTPNAQNPYGGGQIPGYPGTVPTGTIPTGTIPAGTIPVGTFPGGTVPLGTLPISGGTGGIVVPTIGGGTTSALCRDLDRNCASYLSLCSSSKVVDVCVRSCNACGTLTAG